MGKARRVDLGAIDQERTNKQAQSQPRYNQAQQFFAKPGGQSSTKKVALGSLRGVNIVDPTTDDALVFDGTFWIATAQTASGSSSSGISLPVTMPVHDLGTVTTSIISHSFAETSAHVLKMILATDTTLTFTNIPSRHIEFELDVTQDGTGGYELNFAATSIQISNTPAVQSTASKKTVLIGQTHGLTTTSAAFDIFDTALRSAGSAGITSTAFIASWSVYPAIQDVDMASFDINHIVDLEFEAGGNDDAYIHSSGAGLQIKCATGDTIKFIEGTTLTAQFNDFDFWMASNDIRQIQALYFALTTSSIAGISSRLEYNVPTQSIHQFQVNANARFEIGSTGITAGAVLDMNTYTIDNITQMTQSGEPIAASGFLLLRNNQSIGWHVASTSAVAQGTFKYNATDQFSMDSNLNMDTNFIFIPTTPSIASHAVNKKYVDDNITAAAEFPTWTVDHNANSFSLADLVDLDFKAGGAEDAYIHSSGAGLQIKYATGDSIKIIQGAALSAEFLDSDLYMATNDIRQVQAVYFGLTTSSIAGISGALQTNVPSLSSHQFQIAADTRLQIQGATITCFNANFIASPVSFDLGTSGQTWDDAWVGGVIRCNNIQDENNLGDINVFADWDMQVGATVDFSGTSTTATAGAISALPLFPIGYLSIKVNGTNRRVPFYAT